MGVQDKFEREENKIDGYTQPRQPGLESEMDPKPIFESEEYRAADKLKGKVALITGGDSGIGRAVAVLYAKEGADVAIGYYDEHEDAEFTVNRLKELGVKAKAYAHDLRSEKDSADLVENVIQDFGKLNILVNNAGIQYDNKVFEEIPTEEIKNTIETNLFGMIALTQKVIPHLSKGDSIINTTSITAYRGSPHLIDYSATKGGIVAFTRSLAGSLVDRGIFVNGVAPGPIYTPLIPATFDEEQVEEHAADNPLQRRGQPVELAPSYVFLASTDRSYMTGQILHVNGGDFMSS